MDDDAEDHVLMASCLLLTASSDLVGFNYFSGRSQFDYGKVLAKGWSAVCPSP
jgi:hypothetical protein